MPARGRLVALAVLVGCLLLALPAVTRALREGLPAPEGASDDARGGDPDARGQSEAPGDAAPEAGDGAPGEANVPDGTGAFPVAELLERQGWSPPRREAGELGQVATRLLGSYRDAGGCVLAYAGYLDLVGSVWGCVVQGDGWADVCVVHACDEGACEVRVLRIDAEEAVGVLGGDGVP